MDNYLLSASRKRRTRRNPKTCSPWRHLKDRHHQVALSDHRRRWIESMNPEELNLFLGVHGPNKIPKIKDCIHLKVQPYLEVKSRVDPNLPPKIYELGDQSTLNIIGLVDFKKLADKRRNLYKIVVYVIQNEAAYLGVTAPEGYEHKLPFYKRRLFCPLAKAKFHLYYMTPSPQGSYQGVIGKIYQENGDLVEQYLPDNFRP